MNTIDKKPEETLLVVIDPQKGFVDKDGTFAEVFGEDDLKPIQEAISNTHRFINELPVNIRKIFVRSEYRPKQFSEEGPLSILCVPSRNKDCQLSERITIPPNTKVVLKETNDACESAEFISALKSAIREDVNTVIYSGCTTTSCIRETALSTKELFPSVDVIVPMDLVGARASSYESTEDEDDNLAILEGDEPLLKYFGEDSSRVAFTLDDFWSNGISICTSDKIKFSK